MANIMNSIYEINTLDDLAKKDTIIHCIHPLVKLITTFLYLICLVSFNKYEISGLIPFVFYPILITSLGEIPFPLKNFRGFLIGVTVDNMFFPFTTMNRSKLDLKVESDDILLTVIHKNLRLSL